MNTHFTTRIFRLFTYSLLTAAISLLAACGGDGPAAADPTGYYTGTAAVTSGSGAVDIQDLQGLVDGNRFMAMSEAQELLYDGTITSISGNSFSATVKVYKNGALVAGSSISFTGTITQGDKIIGTFGSGTWSGGFTLTYAPSNDELAALSHLIANIWYGPVWNAVNPSMVVNSLTGELSPYDEIVGGVLSGCFVNTGTIAPVPGARIYRVSVTYATCSDTEANGIYTGLATTKDSDNTLVFAVSKANFANATDYWAYVYYP